MYKYTVAGLEEGEADISGMSTASDGAAAASPRDQQQYQYHLKGIVVHSGTAFAGHYYSYIKVGALLSMEVLLAPSQRSRTKPGALKAFNLKEPAEQLFLDHSSGSGIRSGAIARAQLWAKRNMCFACQAAWEQRVPGSACSGRLRGATCSDCSHDRQTDAPLSLC